MERPIRESFVERDEDAGGNIVGYLMEAEYIDALESYIDYLESIKNLPNELQSVSNNEQAKECFHSLTCTHCGKTFKDMLDAEGHRCRLRKHD